MPERLFRRCWILKRCTFSSVLLLCLSSVLLGLANAGCWRLPPPGEGVAGLKRFASPEALKQYLADQVRVSQGSPFFGIGDVAMLGAPVAGAPVPLASNEGGSADGAFSTTNIQEAGVDEGDVVKNDGTYLYILSRGKLQIVRALPVADMAIVSTVVFPELEDRGNSGNGQGLIEPFFFPSQTGSLYLRGNTVAALLDDFVRTRVIIIDVTDRSAPAIVSTTTIEGGLVSSRLIDSKLHLILNLSPILPFDATERAVRQATLGELIPDLTRELADGRSVSGDVVAWQDFYHPINPDGYGINAVVTMDVDDPQGVIRSTAVMANASTVYASPEALYLTNGDFDFFAGRSREKTEIYKFSLSSDGAVLAGVGTVPGRVLNRFSLGEYESNLRVATTDGHVSRSGESVVSNNVYVLGESDGDLKIVGSVENIAPGEQIYAARFVGKRGFLVTFKKVDPLFTLDLSVPSSPKLVGRLKVPGYSEYIHILDENHLLTIGKDAVDMGSFAWYQGVQLSVFDVTQFDDPTLVDAEVIGDRGTESEALNDPHAFNYFRPNQMLAVPMTIAEEAGPEPFDRGVPTFEGLTLFHVDAEMGIEPAGRISTAQVSPDSYGYGIGWTRGIFIGDHVFAVTSSEVSSLPVNDLGAAPARLPLE